MKFDREVEKLSMDELDARHSKRAADRKKIILKTAREAEAYKYDPNNSNCDYSPGMDQDA